MKLLILADIDDFHWKHGGGVADVLLSCGDVSDEVILEAAQAHGCSLILAVKGNHDTKAVFAEPIVDLHLRLYEHRALSFGGMNGSWQYKPRGHFLYDQTRSAKTSGCFSTSPRLSLSQFSKGVMIGMMKYTTGLRD